MAVMATTTAARPGAAAPARFRTLDAMRGFAAVSVMGYHIQSLYDPLDRCAVARSCDFRFSYLAVDMFFALSGFVLAHSYGEALERGLRFTTFMGKRFARLLPIYWGGAALGSVVLARSGLGGLPVTVALTVLAFNWFMLPSPTFGAYADIFPLLDPAWSLFFEVFVANALYALLGRRLSPAVLAALILAGLGGLVATQIHYGTLGVGVRWGDVSGGFARVIYSFFAGVAVNRLHARVPAPRVPGAVVIVLLLASFLAPVPPGLAPAYQLGCVVLLYPALVYLGASAIERRPALGRRLGDASYALYVIHSPLILMASIAMRHFGARPGPLLAAAVAVAVLLLAMAVDRVYDPAVRRITGRLLAPASR